MVGIDGFPKNAFDVTLLEYQADRTENRTDIICYHLRQINIPI